MARKSNTYNGEIIYCVQKWLQQRPKLRKNILLFGAPFEAQAQCVHLEKQCIVDAILSSDSDMVCHGARVLYSGYNTKPILNKSSTKPTGPYVYCQRKHKLFKDLQPNEMAALTAFLGSDYVPGIPKHGYKKAFPLFQAWRRAAKAGEEEEKAYMQKLEQLSPGFTTQLQESIHHFTHYPVYQLQFASSASTDYVKKRRAFWSGGSEGPVLLT